MISHNYAIVSDWNLFFSTMEGAGVKFKLIFLTPYLIYLKRLVVTEFYFLRASDPSSGYEILVLINNFEILHHAMSNNCLFQIIDGS